MKAKELFKMVEQANTLNRLIDKELMIIKFSEEINTMDNNQFYNYKDFKKNIKKTYIDEVAKLIIESDYTQDKKRKNEFSTIIDGTEYTININ